MLATSALTPTKVPGSFRTVPMWVGQPELFATVWREHLPTIYPYDLLLKELAVKRLPLYPYFWTPDIPDLRQLLERAAALLGIIPLEEHYRSQPLLGLVSCARQKIITDKWIAEHCPGHTAPEGKPVLAFIDWLCKDYSQRAGHIEHPYVDDVLDLDDWRQQFSVKPSIKHFSFQRDGVSYLTNHSVYADYVSRALYQLTLTEYCGARALMRIEKGWLVAGKSGIKASTQAVAHRYTFIDETLQVASHNQALFELLKERSPPEAVTQPITKTSKKRQAIPLPARKEVWKNAFGDRFTGNCPTCNVAIDYTNWHCAHVIAVANGGTNAVSNLRPSCAGCNLDMGTRNLDDYKDEVEQLMGKLHL